VKRLREVATERPAWLHAALLRDRDASKTEQDLNGREARHLVHGCVCRPALGAPVDLAERQVDVGGALSPTWRFQDLIDTGEVQVLVSTCRTSPLPMHLVRLPERRHAAKPRAFSEHAARALIDDTMCNRRPVAHKPFKPASR